MRTLIVALAGFRSLLARSNWDTTIARGLRVGVLILMWSLCGQAGAQTLTTLHSFNGTDGGSPWGDLTVSSDGSTLFGIVSSGGTAGAGEIFSIPASGGPLTTLTSFDGANLNHPYGSLTASGSTLYGMTSVLYNSGAGTIFSAPVNGGAATTLASLNGNGAGSQGSGNGRLTLSPDGSTLYGMTAAGFFVSDGKFMLGDGTIFSVPVGGGPVTTLGTFNGNNGSTPQGSLTLSADGSALYGMTQYGGTNNSGTIFSEPVGGGTPTILFSFDGYHGSYPRGSLTLSADGSTLYGMTGFGGDNDPIYGGGTIFSEPIGGGTPTILYSFDNTHGARPSGSLTLSADGSTLYGMTEYSSVSGTPGGDGTIFSEPVGGGTPTTLFLFDGNHGENPYGDLTRNGSVLYGMTEGGGTYGDGTIFALTVPEPSTFALLAAGLLGYSWRRRKRTA